MNRSIYTKLAISNLKNNRKSYIPYVLTAILTVMMYYMMANLAANSPMNQEALQIILSLSVHVIEIFALIFLFYTNSFLIKRRKREIGVYHILGMGKPQLAKMLVIETVVTGAVSILGGIFFGTALAKLMYALLKRMIHYDDKLAFRMSWEIAGNTVLFFTLIFALTLIYNLLQIRLANPIELLHAGSQGEREPKTKWLLTVAGIIFLGIGYYIAITTKEPLKALQLFFVAVICVIIGTYALFTAGSIAFLKLLRKNKNFYYKTKHFISVSGMLYRMKQNAVGLSNICVLSTMVLVTISSTVSLYIGKEDVLRTRYPQEVYITNSVSDDVENQKLHDMVEKICRESEEIVHIHQGARHILFKMGDTILISRRLEGDFLAWRQAIPRNNPVKVTADTKQLLSCIDRVSLIVSEKLKSPLRCVVGDGQIDMTTRTALGNAHDCCPIDGSGNGLEIGFNNKYMMDALKAAPQDKVTLELSSPITPCIIVPAEGEENFLFMVLPVRLKAES